MNGLPLFLFGLTDDKAPTHDVATGFVVAAESEEQARALLSAPLDADAPPEEDDRFNALHAGDEGREVWIDPQLSSCKRIADASMYPSPVVVLKRFQAG